MKFSNKRLSLRGLRTFCVVARHLSFRHAADELFLTPSAVSHQIRNLEQELDLALFQRNPRSVTLTGAGEALLQDVEPLIRQLDEVAARVQTRLRQRAVRMSVQPFFASEMFVPRLPEFASRHPDISIQIDASDHATARHPQNADISIRLFRSAPPNLIADRLFRLRLVPACSPEFRQQWPWSPGECIAGMPLIVHAQQPTVWQQWSSYSEIPIRDPSNVLRLDSMIAIVRAAERGVGLALVPMPLSDGLFRAGKLVRLVDQELLTRNSYFSVLRSEDQGREEVQALRAWILEEFAGVRESRVA